MTRAAYALLHGDGRTALHDNALFVAVLGGLALRGGWVALNQARGRRNGEFFRAQWLWWLLAVALVFTVLRNLPAFAFLSP
jgi:nitric oxide reductase large subunit